MTDLPLTRDQIAAIQTRAEKATPSVKISGTKEQFGTAWNDAVFGHHARADVLALCQMALRAIELEAEVKNLAEQVRVADEAWANQEAELAATRKALELAQKWLVNSVPTKEIDGPKPLPVIADILDPHR